MSLLVVLPTLELLDEELSRGPSRARVHGDKETRYMATFTDWQAWLMQMSGGVILRLVLVLPFQTHASLAKSRVWTLARQVVRTGILAGSPGAGQLPSTLRTGQ